MNAKIVHADADRGAPLAIERAVFARAGLDVYCAGMFDPAGIIAAARDAQVLLVDNAEIDREVVEGLTFCQAIIRYGIGYDGVDTRAATENGILVVNIPAFCVEEVANHALLLILACGKKLIHLDHGIRAGQWPDNRDLEAALSPVGSIYGQRLGLVGLGNIARALAFRAKMLGMQVSACDPFIDPAEFARFGVEPASMEVVFRDADYLSLHVPHTPATHHLVNSDMLRSMKESAFLINTSRGGVVDQGSLVKALIEKWIAGAGLDVFEQEPLPSDSSLLAMDNVVLSPHVASFSDAAFARLRKRVAEEAVRVVGGEWPTSIVNPEVKGNSRFEREKTSA